MVPPPARRHRSEPAEPVDVTPASVLAGRAFVRGKLQPVEIAIGDDGRILSVGKVRTGAPRHDVGDAVILPSATDLHVHFRDPGGSEDVESFASGTVAAALGGVGLVGDMPNTAPPVTDLDTLERKAARVRGRAAIDVLLYASPRYPRERGPLAHAAGGFKVYLSPTPGIDDPPKISEVAALLAQLSVLGLPVSVHAEDPGEFYGPTHPRDPVEWNQHRPPSAERSALDSLLGAPSALRLHIAHVTTGAEAERLRGQPISFEVTPHHLLLSDRSGTDARWKVNPPLRPEADRAALWEAFRRGDVPCLASDHAPHSTSDKALPFDRAPSGVPGVETMLPLMLARVRASELDLGTLVRAACDLPARWLGQPCGRIAAGHRAHLLVVDFRTRTTLSGRRLHSPCGWTPFEGSEAILPREHYRDGVRIVEDGEFVGGTSGTVVRPDFALPATRREPWWE
ncbi:MAG: dihydroorotase family protein [Thermoplasmata archaeon]